VQKDDFDKVPKLRELSIQNFHGIRDLTIPLDTRNLFFGRNGSGKSTVLTAIALACGDDGALFSLAKQGVEFNETSSISLVIESDERDLPPPQSSEYWAMTGLECGKDWESVWKKSGLPPLLTTLLASAQDEPTVRWELTDVSGLSGLPSREVDTRPDRSVWLEPSTAEFVMPVVRHFDRTLMVPTESVPPAFWSWLHDCQKGSFDSGSLPEVFLPLLNSERGESGYLALLALPHAAYAPPIDASICGRGRTPDELLWEIERLEWKCSRTMTDFGVLTEDYCVQGARACPELTSFWAASEWPRQALQGVVDGGLGADGESVFHYYVFNMEASTIVGSERQLRMLSSGEFAYFDIAVAIATVRWERLVERIWRLNERIEAMEPDVLTRRISAELSKKRNKDENSRRLYADFGFSYELGPDECVGIFDRAADHYSAQHAKAIEESQPKLAGLLRPIMARRYRGKIVLVDEPEKGLHATTECEMIKHLDDAVANGWLDSIAVATHSHRFIGQRAWTAQLMSKAGSNISATVLDAKMECRSAALAQELGVAKGELFSQVRKILFVEGEVDEAFLTELYEDRLSNAGVLIFPIHGLNNASLLANLSIVDQLLGLRFFLMSDRTEISAMRDGYEGRRTPEEAKLVELAGELSRRGLPSITILPLRRSDITAYLTDDVLTNENQAWPGWDILLPGGKGDPKPHLTKFGIKPDVRTIRRLAQQMHERGSKVHDDIVDAMSQVTQ